MRRVALIVGLAALARAGEADVRFYPNVGTFTALALSGDTLAVGARGGLMFYTANSPKPVTLGWSGLVEGNPPLAIRRSEDGWLALFGETVAEYKDGRLAITSGAWEPIPPPWQDRQFPDPPPGSRGTHVSALCGTDDWIVAAWWGDGLWKHDGRRWSRIRGAPQARHIVALTHDRGDLAFATQEGGLWWRRGGKWTRLAHPPGPRGSIYSLGRFRDRIVAGSFDRGLQIFDGTQWREARTPTLSTDHPRDLVEFRRNLYVRHSTGIVDRFDGRTWVRNVFSRLPRREVSCLGLGTGTLLVGQFGGWSTFDGSRWEHTLNRPELKGAIVTALAERDGETWIGTQRNGIFRHTERTNALAVYDQRHELTDDWIRTLLVDRQGVIAGTFIGGAFAWEDGRFRRLTPNVRGEARTAPSSWARARACGRSPSGRPSASRSEA
mgnify:FL=1